MRDVIVFAIYLRRQHWCRHVSFDKSGRSETKDAQNTISEIDWPGYINRGFIVFWFSQ